jgi:hypothetical protein
MSELDRSLDREREQLRIDETLATGTRQEIIALREQMVAISDRIKQQVALARREAAAIHRYADHRWLTRAEGAVKAYGRRIMQCQLRLSELNAERKAANIAHAAVKDRSENAQFIRMAKRLLDEDTYLQIWRMVDEAESQR